MRIIFCLMVFLFIGKNTMLAQQLSSFVEYGTTLHTGDNTPLWQVSNQQGLTSLDNNTYIRGGISYKHQLGKWKFEEALDLVAAAGFSTTSFIVQQAYVDIRYKWFGFFAGSREQNSPLLNQELSSGGMTWSGNARPIPQVQIGIPEYVQLLPRLGLKGEISYGWFTDNKYQREQVGEKYWYTKSIKYHHKEGFLRIGIPKGKWQLELGMTLDTQFGGYKIGGSESGDLGNGWKDYVRVFFPGHGREDGPVGEHLAFQGNFLGSEYIKMTYRPKEDFSISAYLDNHFDDFSAMAKLNGWDGLWGVEYKSNHRQAINGIVIEYLQTTNMSGPLHGLQNSVVGKTGGADNYYNNGYYPGWAHWGMAIANPLIASPIYNKDGDMSFKYNRVKALHLGWSGDISSEWRYVAKLSHNRTWGTPHRPIPDILENFSTFASFYLLLLTMNYIQTEIDGVWLIEPNVYSDERGYFMEAFKKEEFEAKIGPVDFVQDNESKSSFGVLRGLHYQKGAYSQAKLVRVLKGKVLDVAVDLRRSSPTFGKHVSALLSEENKRQFFIPRGFAHGFVVLSEEAVFMYKVDNKYAPQAEASIVYNDETLGIDWMLGESQMLLSPKDKVGMAFRDAVYFE